MKGCNYQNKRYFNIVTIFGVPILYSNIMNISNISFYSKLNIKSNKKINLVP